MKFWWLDVVQNPSPEYLLFVSPSGLIGHTKITTHLSRLITGLLDLQYRANVDGGWGR
jgi:hypothetical protein